MRFKVMCFAMFFCVFLINAQQTETVKDGDGNVYTTVKIGNQIWTVENWRSTKYADGTPIPHETSGDQWKGLTTPAYCWYANSTDLVEQKKWGALYNWYAVSTGKIAPKGWRVPTDADWTKLEAYLIANGYNWDGTKRGNKIAKALAAKTDWDTYRDPGTPGNDLSKNNASGFSALPGGYRSFDGTFYGQSDYGTWWSATENVAFYAYYRNLYFTIESLLRLNYLKRWGFSVRLLRD